MNDEKKKVLTIDDTDEIRDLVSITLRGSEFDIYGASNGREGIQVAKEILPDIILLDIMMPGFDGFMTASVLKRNPATRKIPVIFLSAKKTKEDIQQAIKTGGADYIVKPFSPTDLMTRLRNKIGMADVNKKKDEREQLAHDTKIQTNDISVPEITYKDLAKQAIIRKGDVVICKGIVPNLDLGSCSFYRGVFSNIMSDGFFKIVFDIHDVQNIDASGLALLISVNMSLAKYDGELRITYPKNEIKNRFTYINLNDMFNSYATVHEAVSSFSEFPERREFLAESTEINLCTSCTYVNIPEARYCGFCGANLMLGGSESILAVLKQVIARKVMEEAQTTDISMINSGRAITAEENEIPSEFNVEIIDSNFLLKYKSIRTVRKFYSSHGQIAIQAPVLKHVVLPVQPGMKLFLTGTKTGMHTAYETMVKSVDSKNHMIFVEYSEDAKAIHSIKNFSIAPAIPIPIHLINPSLGNTGDILRGKILEISRARMVVFTEAHLSEDECLAVHFDIPNAGTISTPLVVPRKLRDRFMYELEFIVIDERERSRIIQYMYSRQIEMAKVITENNEG